MTSSERRLRARIAAHSMHAQGKTNTKPAREAFLAGKSEEELRVHMLRMSLASVKARRKAA